MHFPIVSILGKGIRILENQDNFIESMDFADFYEHASGRECFDVESAICFVDVYEMAIIARDFGINKRG